MIQAVDKPRPEGVEVIRLERAGGSRRSAIVVALRRLGLNRLLIEGGGITIAQFLEADYLTRLHVAVAPLLIGAGPQGLTTAPVATLAQARRPRPGLFAGIGCGLRLCPHLGPVHATRCAEALQTSRQ